MRSVVSCTHAPRKEDHNMVVSVNRVVLVGQIGRYGVSVAYHESGTPRASFTLVICEQGQDGKTFPTLIDCQVWGRKAEAAGELEAGQLVLFEGKLAKRKRGEQWEMVVSGFELTPLTAPLPTLTGRSN
jgi:single-stranded DNA-binding protein